ARAARGVLVAVPPEHVRLKVAAGEVEEEQAVVVVLERVVPESKPPVEDQVRLPQILRVVENAVAPRLGVFLETGRVGPADARGDITRERLWLGDRRGGRRRIDVDRTDIEAERRLHLLQIEATHAADVLVGDKPGRLHLEVERDPAAPLTGSQRNAFALNLDDGGAGLAIAVDQEVDAYRLRPAQHRILRAGEAGARPGAGFEAPPGGLAPG